MSSNPYKGIGRIGFTAGTRNQINNHVDAAQGTDGHCGQPGSQVNISQSLSKVLKVGLIGPMHHLSLSCHFRNSMDLATPSRSATYPVHKAFLVNSAQIAQADSSHFGSLII